MRAPAAVPKTALALGYIQGLDGIRALAVLAVILFHANLPRVLPAGFLGVDMFFVLSGFLITRLLLVDMQRFGHMATGHFYLRRIKRLLPAILALALTVLGYSYFFAPDALVGVRKDLPSALFYYSNFWQLYDAQPYFAQFERPSPFQHFWSLAIEEQFYILWPLLLALLYRLRRWLPLPLTVGGLAAASLGWMAWLAYRYNIPLEAPPERLYLSTDTHAHGLLMGAFWASLASHIPKLKKGWQSISLGLLGMAALVFLAAFLSFSNDGSEFLYRGGFLAVELATIALIWAACTPSNPINALLNSPAFSWLGRRSYSLYLWHWPVFVFLRPGYELPESIFVAFALRIALTMVLAELCYRWVENPLRNLRWMRLSMWAKAVALTGCTAVLATLTALYLGDPVGARLQLPRFFGTVSTPAPGLNPIALAATTTTAAPATIALLHPLVEPTYEVLADTELQASTPSSPPTASTASPTPLPRPSSAIQPDTPVPQTMPAPVSPPISSPIISPLASTMSGRVATVETNSQTTQVAPSSPSPSPSPPIASTPLHIQAFGDSVMLGAKSTLAKKLPHAQIDAKVGRQASDLLKILQSPARQASLSPSVVIHIGTNGYIYEKNLKKILELLKDQDRVLLITIHADRRWADENNSLLRRIASQHRNVALIDWNTYANAHREFFVQDGIHLTGLGMQAYAELVRTALPATLPPIHAAITPTLLSVRAPSASPLSPATVIPKSHTALKLSAALALTAVPTLPATAEHALVESVNSRLPAPRKP
ncbi:MAG: acyltransferase family protein [Brachymonas sp.]